MMTEALTLYKLMILYMLERVDFPLTNSQISEFILDKGYTNYFAVQQAVNERFPTLARPISLVKERYNQHLSTGMFILEVGSSGNSLQEALTAVRLYAEAVAPALLRLAG